MTDTAVVAEHVHVKPWVTDAADRAYLDRQYRRLEEVNDERKRLAKRITHREAEAWDRGGRELFLAWNAGQDPDASDDDLIGDEVDNGPDTAGSS